MDYQTLLKLAQEAKYRAYAPYSGFRVGAALLTSSGKVYLGCNVECASYAATSCAERTAIVKAVSEGELSFKAIAIASDSKTATFPCGICRQVIVEFGEDIDIIVGTGDADLQIFRTSELLPKAFTKINIE